MALQKGAVRYRGAVGDLTYRKTRFGYVVGEKSSLDAERIRTDAAFKRTRENAAEFKNAANATKLLIDAVKTVVDRPGNYNLFSRLVATARRVLSFDTINTRGQRTVADGLLTLFQDFDFNSDNLLVNVLPLALTPSIDRVTGDLEVVVPSFVPKTKFSVAETTTHFKLTAVGTELDFVNGTHKTASAESAYLPINMAATAPLTLTCSATPNSTLPLFLGFSVSFYQELGTVYYPIRETNNPLKLLQVDA